MVNSTQSAGFILVSMLCIRAYSKMSLSHFNCIIWYKGKIWIPRCELEAIRTSLISNMLIAIDRLQLNPHRTWNHILKLKCELPETNFTWISMSPITRSMWELLKLNNNWISMTWHLLSSMLWFNDIWCLWCSCSWLMSRDYNEVTCLMRIKLNIAIALVVSGLVSRPSSRLNSILVQHPKYHMISIS